MSKLLKIESTVTGLKQTVTQEELDVLTANGGKYKITDEVEAPKAAKTPEEVKTNK